MLRVDGFLRPAGRRIVVGLLAFLLAFPGLAAARPAEAAGVTFVQQVSAHQGSASGDAISVTPASDVTAGNRLVVLVGVRNGNSPTAGAVTDTAGNTYAEVLHFVAADGTEESVWTAPITAGGGTRPTVTATASGPADLGIAVLEYQGLSAVADATLVDQQASASGTTTGAATVSSGATGATSGAGGLALGFYVDSGFGDTLTAGSGWTSRVSNGPQGDMEVLVEEQTVAQGATPNASVGTGANTTWLLGTVVFRVPGVPGAPAGVTATAGNAQATVSWTAPASNGGSPITSYTVTSSPDGLTASVGGSATTATVTGMTNGTAYTFTVTAANAVGTGPASAPSSAVTPSAGATVPGAPTGVTASPGNAQATVSWTAPASNGGSPITGYTVTAAPGGLTASVSVSTTTATVTGMTNGTAYTFTVTAANAVGTGPASAPSSVVTPATVPDPPTGVTATAGNAQAVVGWTAPASNGGSPITSYTVTSEPGGLTASVDGSTTTATVTGLTNGTAYTLTVSASNAAGTGLASSPSSAVTPVTVPGAPSGVTATAGDAQVVVSWTAPASDGGSAITTYTVTSTPDGLTASVDGSTTSATVTGLTNGTTYTFTVTATNAVGTGPASAPSNPVTPVGVPTAPMNVSATAGNAQATVSWGPPQSNGGSAITTYTVSSSPGGLTASVNGSTTSATLTGLVNGTSYTFQVVATNAIGSGPPATSSPITIGAVPSPPQQVTAIAGDAEAVVSWTPPASDGGLPILDYTVTAFPFGGPVTTNATSVTMTGLINGYPYQFLVRARNAIGSSAYGMSQPVTPSPLPAAPSGVTATVSGQQVTISWSYTSPPGTAAPTSFTVAGSSYLYARVVPAAASSATFDGVQGGTYSFQVSATNGYGTGSATSSSTVTVAAGPAGFTSVAAGSRFSLAIKADGTLWAWGEDAFGELGCQGVVGPAPPASGLRCQFHARQQLQPRSSSGLRLRWNDPADQGHSGRVGLRPRGRCQRQDVGLGLQL